MITIKINLDEALVALSYQELLILNNSINEARESLGTEFSTRVGVEVEVANSLLKQLQVVIEAIGKASIS